MIETTNNKDSTQNSREKANSYKINEPEVDQKGNHKIKQKLSFQDQPNQDQKIDLAGAQPSTKIWLTQQVPMSSNNKYNQYQDINGRSINGSYQQSPQVNNINNKINGRNDAPYINNNKENMNSGQNSIDMQMNQNEDLYLSQRQQPQQQGYGSQNKNLRSDSFFIDENNLNRSTHNMIVASEKQTTHHGGFGNTSMSQGFEGNPNPQQQIVYNRIQYLKEQMEKLEDHDSLLLFFKAYTVHNADIITIEEIIKSDNVKLKRYKQSVYFGEMINNKRCGKGIMIYINGRVYEGEWQNDFKFGRGFELFPNGNRYEGYFVNGKSEGMGTYVWLNNEIYDGQWLGGMKHGSGMWRGPKGDSYIGEWKFGKADGYGVHTWLNGDRYEGQFKVCLKHGEGTEKFSNGDFYQGQYINGRPEGYGEYTWLNNSHYKGSFKNGLRHGKGIWRRSLNDINSDRYEGEYQNDKKCGFGVFKWASGNEFRGNYFDDLRHGYGEMFWTDGSFYKGNWERGIQSGEGELYMPGESIKRGLFVNNIFKGNFVSDEDQFVNKQQQNLMQYNQQQQLFKENSKYKLTPKKIQTSKSAQKRLLPYQLSKINNPSPNSMNSPFKRGSIKSSLKKKSPSVERNNKSLLNQVSPQGRKSISNTNNKKNYGNHDLDTERKNNLSINGGNSFRADPKEFIRNSFTEEDQSLKDKSMYDRKIKSSIGNIKQQNQISPHTRGNINKRSNSPQFNGQAKRRSISVSANRPDYFEPNSMIRNNSITPNDNKSILNNSQITRLPQINNKSFNGKKQKEILLKKHEIILWKNLKPKLLHLKKGDFTDFTDPITVQKIRTFLHPPIWKPVGVYHQDQSPERENSLDRFNEASNCQSLIFQNQKRLKSNHQ